MGDIPSDKLPDRPGDSLYRVPDLDVQRLIAGRWGRRVSGRILSINGVRHFHLNLEMEEGLFLREHFMCEERLLTRDAYRIILNAMTERLADQWARNNNTTSPSRL
jgi:hypothetical protein